MRGDSAILFDVKEFAVHDGPGVRTTVFFKGCPLRCVWCHNPEGLSPERELMTQMSQCRGCGKCRIPCNHEACRPFGRCLYACPDACLSICGREWTADELTARLSRGADLLRESGGGVTFSGGEPLLQSAFLLTMLARMRELGLHTAVETSGYAAPDIFDAVCRAADLILMDLKLADSEMHRRYTGVPNASILRNAAALQRSGTAHVFRTPLIPGITDTPENLDAIRALVGDSPHEILPYNTLAGAKYPMLGIPFPYDTIKENSHD